MTARLFGYPVRDAVGIVCGGWMSALDVAAFRDTPLERDPFDFIVVPGFVKREGLPALHTDFPKITRAGLFPLSELRCGPAFAALIGKLKGAEVEAAFSEKFGVKLEGRPLMITIRGRCQRKDGRVHPDTIWKIVTDCRRGRSD